MFLIRTLHASDIPSAWQLAFDAGWNQTQLDWQRLLDYNPSGCFAAKIDDQLIGTVTTTPYGRDLAWIGMMLVAPIYRRQGVASALMQHSVDHLRGRQVESIKLDATPSGQPLYEKLGFRCEWRFQRWHRPASAAQRHSPGELGDKPLPSDLLKLDSAAFGADRHEFLNVLAAESTVQVEPDGFGMLRHGARAAYLGPISAASESTARRIVQGLCSLTNNALFWDVPAGNLSAERLADQFGFQPNRELMRMWYGEKSAGDLTLQYALADPGTG